MDAIEDIYSYFVDNKVKIMKMNHCLNDSGFTHFEGYIQLADDRNFLKIVNMVPNNKYKITSNQKDFREE